MKGAAQDNEIIIDTDLLREAALRQLRFWLMAGPVLLALCAGYQLFVMPQTYTATASLAVQQSSMPSSLLALTGQSESHKYLGILHSRLLAEAVEKKAQLQQFYHLPTHRKTLEMLTSALKPEDNAAEGLLFLNVTLPGPPRFANDPTHKREQTMRLAANVANLYIAALKNYYALSDNDRDSVLLRAGEDALHQAHQRYDVSRAALRQFIRSLSNREAASVPNGPADPSSGVPLLLQGLYDTENRVEADIRSAEAARSSVNSGRNRQLSALSSLPTEDPLLMAARDRVTVAKEELNLVRNVDQLADENPRVVRAKNRLSLAQEELSRQLKGYRSLLTSDRLKEDSSLQGFYARRDIVKAKIKRAESLLPVRRELGNTFSELLQQQELALAELKSTEGKVAELRLTAVSGLSRLKAVDEAIAPDSGQPGITRILLISLVPVLLLFGVSLFRDYAKESRHRTHIRAALADELNTNPILPGLQASALASEQSSQGTILSGRSK